MKKLNVLTAVFLAGILFAGCSQKKKKKISFRLIRLT